MSFKVLSKPSSRLLFCLVLPIVTFFLLGVPEIWPVNFKTMLPASSVLLPVLIIYLWPFVLYAGSLMNAVLSTQLLFLPLNHWTTKSLPVSLISSRCMFCLTNSVCLTILVYLPSVQLKSSGQCTFYYQAPFLWNNLSYSLWCSSSMASSKSALKTHLFPS